MPRRTAEASKAIRLAWQRECILIQEGKGTRDWTEEQQKNILDPEIGKAYDEDGKPFEGHHMKSAEAYPEYQGNSENIQFLSRTEHAQAHGGWRKPTNGFFDYTTGITYEFGEVGFTPCEIIKLSNPVIAIDTYIVETDVNPIDQIEKEHCSGTAPPTVDPQPSVISKCEEKSPVNQVSKGTVVDGLMNVTNVIKDLSDKHPRLTTAVEIGLGLAVTAVTGKAISTKIKAKTSGSSRNSLLNDQTYEITKKKIVDIVGKFDFKKSESILKQRGYTVAKNRNLSERDRQDILQKAITTGEMAKDTVCALLEKNINLHKNQNTFGEAVSKWMADLAYIREL